MPFTSNTVLIISLSCLLLYSPGRSSATACNNSPSLCGRAYNNVTHLGAHDSPFLRDVSTDYTDSGDQFYNSTVQLSAGVRLLTGQIYYVNSTSGVHLCHSSCDLLDAGRLVTWLSGIKTWLDDNPNEVVTILLVNGDNIEADDIATEFEYAGLTKLAYSPPNVNTPPTDGTWPTLESLINDGTRLMVFIASLPSLSTSATYLMDEFNFIFENPYDYTNQTEFSCVPQRPSSVEGSISEALAAGLMPLQNHFVYSDEFLDIEIPDLELIYNTNAPLGSVNSTIGSLGQSAKTCADDYDRAPTFILVDFFNVGPAINTVDTLNGVTDIVGRTTVSAAVLTSSSSRSATMSFSDWALILSAAFALVVRSYS